MPSFSERQYTRTIDYLEDLIGADVSRDVLKVALASQDIATTDQNIEQVGGQSQSAVDIAAAINTLAAAAASDGSEVLQTEQQTPVKLEADDDGGNTAELQGEELGTALAGTETALITYLSQALASVDNDELISRVADSAGAQVDPALGADYPDTSQQQDLVGTGDLTIGPVPVGRTEAVVIAANSDDDNTFSISVEWQDDGGNVLQSESASDIELNSVDNEYARLVRKGQQFQATVTDESGAGQNNVNVFIDTHK